MEDSKMKGFESTTFGVVAKLAVSTLLLSGAGLAQSAANTNLGCSLATLAGTYAFHITGQILAPAPAAGPVSGVALTVFDGFGNLTQVDNVVHNGVAPAEDWRPAVGTYTVNSNCTGTFTFYPMPTNPQDAGPALMVHFVVLSGGSEIRTVVTSSPNTPPFAASITSTGTRLLLAP
jgi:hypothetical protein